MPPVNVMIKPASGLCNMRCTYCFYADEAQKRQQASMGLMREETAVLLIEEAYRAVDPHGAVSFAFQGGEPTLRGLPFFEKALEYTRQYNQNGAQIHFALQTNGFALTDEWARFFRDNHFLIGVSVDGTKAIHDTFRHPAGTLADGTFERVIESVRLLEKYDVEYNILTVVHKLTAENIREIYGFYRKQHWDYMQFIPCLDPLAEEPGRKPYSLLPETYGRFLMDLFDLWYEDVKKGQMLYIRQFENYVGMLMGVRPEACDQRGHCGLQYVAEADGSVYPCDFYALDEWRLGNFNTDRLTVIDETRLSKHFLERSDPLHEDCRSCPWLSLCRGGCFRCRTGDLSPDQPDVRLNYFCKGYRMFFEYSSERMKELADEFRKGR